MTRFTLQAETNVPRIFPGRIRTAFSLLEMLVVMAVVALLATILVSVVRTARQSADMAVCTSRLRELGNAFQLYTNDHAGNLPFLKNRSGSRWPMHVASYLGAPYQTRYDANGEVDGIMPAMNIYENQLLRDPFNQFNPSNAAEGTFAINVRLGSDHQAAAVNLATLSRPGTFPVLATSEGNGTGGGLLLEAAGPSPRAAALGYAGATHRHGPAPNYGRQAIFLFADWHVSAVDVCDSNQWPWNDSGAFLVR